MEHELDGTGGGFGRYRGVPIKELEAQFARCRSEGGMRGVSAVLRIAREQLDARGGLGSYPWLTALCLIAAVAFWFFPFQEGPLKDWRAKGTIGAAFLTLLFGWVTVSTWQDRRKGLYQESRIRDLALDALLGLVRSPGFKPKPLDYTQRLTLERMLKRTKKPTDELAVLLREG